MMDRIRGRLKHHLALATFAAGLILPAVAPAATAVRDISINDNFFDPAFPAASNLATGSDFRWTRAAGSNGLHNVRQDQLLFRSGDPTTGPIDYTITASAGSYHYFCEIHGSSTTGMQGRIKVRPAKSNLTSSSFVVRWASAATQTGDQFDLRYRVDGGSWANWKTNTTAFSATFGANGNPVTVTAGHTHQVEARSEKAGTTSKSNWSPPVKVST
jgi:plastocyanin